MTKVITRYFEDAARARVLERELLVAERFPRNILRVFASVEDMTETLAKYHVEPETVEAYRWRMDESGGAVVLVLAGYKPMSVANTAREVLDRFGAVEIGNVNEEVYIDDGPGNRPMVIGGTSLVLTRPKDPTKTNYHMADWPLPLIVRSKPYDGSLLKDRHGRMANWPIRLTTRMKPRDEYAFPRHARMANLIFPLTIRRKPSDNFIFDRHARMANWPLSLISKRKPYSGSAIGKHPRMANWPFPHLINGKTGTNSLIPGAPRMANFPLPLLSGRKPSDKFAFPRHARMANMIMPLLSGRKPFTGSIFDRHARMANFPLPLVTKSGGSGFSLSKMLGMPTISRK